MRGEGDAGGGLIALVGGNLGVGPAVRRAFLNTGAKVVTGVLPEEKKTAVFNEIAIDMEAPQSVSAFFDGCEAQGQTHLGTLILVPPPVRSKDALAITDDEYRETIARELIGPIFCIKEAARRMVGGGHAGRIISFVSMSGKTGVHRHVAPYAASKGGLIAFSRALAAELAPTGITVNVIATALFDVQVAAMSDGSEAIKGIPVGRPGRSDEAAEAALYLASHNAGYVTGETLNLSGGRFMD